VISQAQIQLDKIRISSLDLDSTSMNNLKNFVLSQKNVNEVKICFMETDSSPFTPIFTHLLNLDSLVVVKIEMDDDVSKLPADQINNRHVHSLHIADIESGMIAHYLRLFPQASRLEVNLSVLFNNHDNAISTINEHENLVELVISGRYSVDDDDWNEDEDYLKQLRIKNLAKISFREYPARNGDRIEIFREFCKNHPNLKEFKMETSNVGIGVVEVIVKNLKHLEKFTISTENSTFAWNQDDLCRIRESKGVKIMWF
jgi:hypothetical protein